MQAPKEQEWVIAEGIQGMEFMPVLILTVGDEITSTKWSFGGYRFYPGQIDYQQPAYLYASREAALADNQPNTTLICWRQINPMQELIDDLILALTKYQSNL